MQRTRIQPASHPRHSVRAADAKRSAASGIPWFMKKYSVLVRGENFLIKVEGEDQKLGFYTTAFVEAKDEDEASKKAVDLLRDDQEFKRSVSNDQSDPPLMFVDEIAE